MEPSQTQAPAPAIGLLNWLRFSREEAFADDPSELDEVVAACEEDSPAAAVDPRADLLTRIGDFLLDNELAISAENLAASHSIFSGSDPQLAQKVRYRARSKQPITQEWLSKTVSGQDESTTTEQYHDMMDRLETDLDAFAETTKGAYCSSAAYGAHLARHASELENLPPADTIVAEIAHLTKTMLERTRRVEDEMRRSESEAASLRRSLAAARQDAELDYLTQLPNRRAFEGILTKQSEEAKKVARPLSLAFCDIDNFKLVNDVHGHEAGDRVIRAVADVLSRGSGNTCHVARHGGEEFVMLFVGLTASEAKAQLDGIREKLARRHFVNRDTEQPIGQVTFSGGVADVAAFDDPRDALAAADSALYFAKDEGRNRICLAS
ncbi:GGDEF domain-containing protein [Altererythrobacter sp. ZODW24]|uniref:GGDEF domain-containing protein n=1 Tax=Altererythrobacter sp. ZODW24 TaxID=2185142 RepID=UPI000DF7E2B2|nr:GGDEF domain-containing protein [Altererythrobacter sp. ZODW24]